MNNIQLSLIALFVAGCSTANLDSTSTQNHNESPTPTIEDRRVTNANESKVITNQVAVESSVVIKKSVRSQDPNTLFENYSVYFDLDEYTVQERYLPIIKQHAEFLIKHPDHFVFIEGHTDERGGAEYNLALGQKRSTAVKKLLILYGVKEQQLEAYSYGKEKPKALGSNEEAWSQNRRVDLHYRN